MQRIEFLEDETLPTGTSYLALMFMIASISLFSLKGKTFIKSRMLSRFTILLVWVYFISILYSSSLPFTRANYILIILPLFLFCFTSLYRKYLDSTDCIVWCMTVVAAILLVDFVKSMFEVLSVKRTSGSYYILYFLPFLLCHKNKLVRTICVVLTFVVVVLSVKIGGVLSIFFAMMTYTLVKQQIISGKKFEFKSLFLVAIIILFLGLIVLYLDDKFLGGFFADHMSESNDSGGSGRTEIYGIYIKLIFNSSLIKFFFGHGWLGSEHESGIGLTCHNDFLEAFFDFGLIGFILYCMFHLSLFATCRRMIKRRSELAPVMCASVVIFFINSMLAHVFIYPWYLMIFTLFWGFINSGLCYNRKL